jgi:hypothetical protein
VAETRNPKKTQRHRDTKDSPPLCLCGEQFFGFGFGIWLIA